MTPEGHRQLQEELKRLKGVERPRIVAEIEAARGHGDISENAEYHAAKEKQGLLTRKIAEIENRISQADVIDPKELDHSKVVFGSTVALSDTETGEEVKYQIVGEGESDVPNGRISVTSPIARSLIGKGPGDVVRVVTPRGTREFEILEVG